MPTTTYDVNDILNYLATPLKRRPIFYFNGIESADGWEILQEVRSYSEKNDLGLNMVVVKTHSLTVKIFAVGEFSDIDLMKSDGKRQSYWFEYGWKSVERWVNRKSMKGFTAMGAHISPSGVKTVIKLIVGCSEEEYVGLADALESAESVVIEGMMVDISALKKQEQEHWFLVHTIQTQKIDYSGANTILSKMSDWREIAPMRHAETKELFFPEDTMLAIMASVLFVRDKMAQFNTIFFGKTGHGKTAALEFFVKSIMQGSQESATISSGKGWGVSHAKDAPPSILLSEPNVVYVNEMFKAAGRNNAGNVHSYSITLKQFLETQMEILERGEVTGSSGLGRVKGTLKAAFIASENDDDNLKRALGRAFMIANATFRRIQFGLVWREIDQDKEMGTGRSHQRMKAYLCSKFGHDAMREIKNLYLYSRKFTKDHEFEAPIDWRKKVRQNVLDKLRVGKLLDKDLPDWFDASIHDAQKMDLYAKVVDDLFNVQKDAYTSCYVSAAIIRGWEVYNSIDELKPCEDDRQKELAEMLFTYLFMCKLKILADGIEEFIASKGIQRSSPYGGH